MINTTELRAGTTLKEGGEIFEVISYQHTKIGRGSANIKIKARNLKTGLQVEKSFTSGAKVEEAETKKKKLQYLYKDNQLAIFMDTSSFEQFPISLSMLGEKEKFLREGEIYEVLTSEDVVLNVELPKLITLGIAETGPGVKGDTVSNVFKDAILENDLKVKVPLFINIGDKVKVDTRSGEYVERVK